MAAVRHLGFAGRLLGPRTKVLVGVYRCAFKRVLLRGRRRCAWSTRRSAWTSAVASTPTSRARSRRRSSTCGRTCPTVDAPHLSHEPGNESTSVEYLWTHLSGLIIVAEQFLHAWPGLFYKVSQSTNGDTPDISAHVALRRQLTGHYVALFFLLLSFFLRITTCGL